MKKTRDPEIFLRGSVYWYRGTPLPGKPEIKRSLKVNSFGKARAAKKQFLLQIKGINPHAQNIRFSDLAEDYFLVKKKVSQTTKNKANAALNYLKPFFGHYLVKNVDQDLVDSYIRTQRQAIADFVATSGKRGRKSKKLTNDITKLNEIMLRGYRKGILERPIQFKNPDPKKNPRRPLTDIEIKLLLRHSKGALRVFVIVGFTMGMRPGEQLKAEWAEINLEAGSWFIPAEKNKNSRDRTISISPRALRVLRAWRHLLSQKQYQGGYLYPPRYQSAGRLKSMDGPLKRALKDAGLDQSLVAYNLRHTFCTRAAQKIQAGQTTIVHVCRYADHDIQTFDEHYLHLTTEDTRAVASLVEVPQ